MDTSYIGKPIHYATGPNAGRTIRAELSEYQKPDLGRKFAKRDRRPLDPPPVVRVRLWEVFDAGLHTQTERELTAEEIEIQGLVAHVDLFRANSDGSIQADNPAETANLTKHCFGSSFVHATHILDLTGQPAIIFVFADLSVRLEGVFALRYRIFDLVSRMEGLDEIPVAAELYGGVFTVYSTKEFPGLTASTPLTKHLSRWGVRVNLREGERKRKASGDDDDDDDDDADDDDGGDAGGAGPSKKGAAAKAGRSKGGVGKVKPKVTRPSGVGTDASLSQTHASFSDFQTPHPPDLTAASAVPESVSHLQSTSVTPTSPPKSHPPSSVVIDTKSQARDPNTISSQQTPWAGAPVSWSRPPLATANSGGDWGRSGAEQPISIQSTHIVDWNQRPNKQVSDSIIQEQRLQEGSGPPKDRSRKRARMTIPNGHFDADTPPGLSQPSPEDVANLAISSSARMLTSGSTIPVSQSPNFITQQSNSTNYAQVLATAAYPPSQPPPLAPAQRTNSFSPNSAYAMQPPSAVPVSAGHLATQSPIGMHSPASFAIPSSTGQYVGYRSGR